MGRDERDRKGRKTQEVVDGWETMIQRAVFLPQNQEQHSADPGASSVQASGEDKACTPPRPQRYLTTGLYTEWALINVLIIDFFFFFKQIPAEEVMRSCQGNS